MSSRRDEEFYFYNKKTKQLRQKKDNNNEPRAINFTSVQRAKKNLASVLWVDNVEFKIKKQDNKYIVESSKFLYSPFADNKFTIKRLEVIFKRITTHPRNEYENIKIVTGDEYNEILNKKLMRLSSAIINGDKSFYMEKVDRLNELNIGTKKSRLDEKFELIISIVRMNENEFVIQRAYKNALLAICIDTSKKDRFTYYELTSNTAKITNLNVTESINFALELLENK